MVQRAAPGQAWSPPKATDWNAIGEATEYFQKLRAGTPNGSIPFSIPTDTVKLRNDSGGILALGRVLEVGASLFTASTVTRETMWFEGDVPAPDGADTFAVLLRAAPASKIVDCQVSGLAFVRLNVNHVQQQWADVNSSSTLLQSKWHGRAKIIWKETATTGEQNAVVQLGHDFRGPINIVCTSGITAGSSASCAVYWAGSAASPSATITVYLNWMDGGNDIASGAEAQCFWHPDQQKYIVSNAECGNG